MRPSRPRALLLATALLTAGCGASPGDVAPGPSPAGTAVPATTSAATSLPAPSAAGSSAPASPAPGTTAPPPSPGATRDPGPAPDPAPALDDPASLAVVVNKRRPLVPAGWAPAELETVEGHRLRPEAAGAARELLAAARADGAGVVLLSGYRSYDEQVTTYAGWVAQQGREAADTVSARPGHSEHQTGLALDVGEGGPCDLRACFAGTATAAWVAEHAPEHGFVVRYPPGQEPVTGYAHEPWHLRYLGPERARALARSGAATLEEFSGLGPAPDYAAEPAPGG